jgi:hypothetical protein
MTRHELGEEQAAMRARNAAAAQNVTTNTVDPLRPFTVSEVAVLHGLSRPTIIALYENERGVVILENTKNQEQSGARRRRVLRIPRSVYARVRRRMEVQ